MLRRIKNFLYMMVTGSITMLLSACYGPMVEDQRPAFKVTKPLLHFLVQDTNNQPILGIEISAINNSNTNILAQTTSGSDGNAVLDFTNNDIFHNPTNFSVILADIDGNSNGGHFLTNTVALDGHYSYTITLSTN